MLTQLSHATFTELIQQLQFAHERDVESLRTRLRQLVVNDGDGAGFLADRLASVSEAEGCVKAASSDSIIGPSLDGNAVIEQGKRALSLGSQGARKASAGALKASQGALKSFGSQSALKDVCWSAGQQQSGGPKSPQNGTNSLSPSVLLDCAGAVPVADSPSSALTEFYERSKNVVVKRILKAMIVISERWQSLKAPERSGFLARVVESSWFHAAVIFVILSNVLFIALTTNSEMVDALEIAGHRGDAGKADAESGDAESVILRGVEYGFTIFYTLELLARFRVHGTFLLKCSEWRWYVLDMVLVVVSLVDLAIDAAHRQSQDDRLNLTFLRFLRGLRLAKVLRMFRAVRFLQQLRLMLDCIIGCMSALAWCLLLISFFLFLFSVIFVQGMTSYVSQNTDTINEENLRLIEDHLGGIISTVISLFQAITGGMDWESLYELVKLGGNHLAFLFIMFVGFFTVAVFNIVTSNFVEKALKLSIPDVDTLVKDKRMKDIKYAAQLTVMLQSKMDTNADGYITFEEFTTWYHHSEFTDLREFLAVRGLDLKDAQAFFLMLTSVSEYEEAVDIATFVGGCLRLQGLATSLDLQAHHFEMKSLLLATLNSFNELLEAIKGDIPPGSCSLLLKRWTQASVTSATSTIEPPPIGVSGDPIALRDPIALPSRRITL